jgi:hypothetical protein
LFEEHQPKPHICPFGHGYLKWKDLDEHKFNTKGCPLYIQEKAPPKKRKESKFANKEMKQPNILYVCKECSYARRLILPEELGDKKGIVTKIIVIAP